MYSGPTGCAVSSPSSVIRVKTMEDYEWFVFVVSTVLTITTILNFYAIAFFTSTHKNFGVRWPYRREQIFSMTLVPPVSSLTALIILLAPRHDSVLHYKTGRDRD